MKAIIWLEIAILLTIPTVGTAQDDPARSWRAGARLEEQLQTQQQAIDELERRLRVFEEGEAAQVTANHDSRMRFGPREGWRYSTDYLFGFTRAVAGSSASSASKPVWFLFSVPLDVAFLPFAALGGLAG